jgi:hypothetical protein
MKPDRAEDGATAATSSKVPAFFCALTPEDRSGKRTLAQSTIDTSNYRIGA